MLTILKHITHPCEVCASVAPWLAPFIPAYLTYKHTSDVLRLHPVKELINMTYPVSILCLIGLIVILSILIACLPDAPWKNREDRDQ
jgi:uncharacterized membrane protein required for colicin V production